MRGEERGGVGVGVGRRGEEWGGVGVRAGRRGGGIEEGNWRGRSGGE